MIQRKSLGDLLADTPQMIVDLAKAEVEHLKQEVAGKAKGLGVGAALLAAAGFFAIFLFSWLIYAGFEGLNVVFAPWLSALIVSAVLLVVGSRGLGAFRGMLLGAVSNDVVRSAPGTVLVVHGVGPTEAEAA